MKHPLSFLAGFTAGALAMYYIDTVSGGRRRALVRDKIVSAGHDVADLAEAKGKRAMDHVKGAMATGNLNGMTRTEPESEQQLHDRIRSRLGRVISHPKALQVEVEGGCVCLRGHVLRKEVDNLLSEVQGMAGVTQVRNELEVHDSPEGISALQGRTEPPGARTQREIEESSR
jgi:osmotically-inducible protein OsmY